MEYLQTPTGEEKRLGNDGVSPQRRDRRHDHRGPGCRPVHRPDQDRSAVPLRASRQVQPAAQNRGGARRAGSRQVCWKKLQKAFVDPFLKSVIG